MSLPRTIAGLRNLRFLILDDNRLTRLPAEIGGLEALTKLQTARNHLAFLPREIGRLRNLSELSLDENQLSELPKEIGHLESLQTLSLSGNGLRALVPEIGLLRNLQTLRLNANNLEKLPPEIAGLENLRVLDLEGNRLTTLPPEIGRLRHLKILRLKDNRIDHLPSEVGLLQDLTDLDLQGNRLRELPSEIGGIENLRVLNLRSNHLHRIPESLASLGRLSSLDLRDNALSLPLEILEKTYSPSRILDHLSLQREEPRRALGEAKVLLVGQGGVGKTSVVKRLVENTYEAGQGRTNGIEITSWKVALGHSEARLHVWDFGGQEIMHSTHQFFLTHRSLYLLILDSRLGEAENRLAYWLKLIQSFGGDSPVILVGNKSDQAQLDLDRRSLLAKYPNLRAIVATSCLTGDGIEALQESLLREVATLKHLWDEVPESWYQVKSRLSEVDKDFLTLSEFRGLCESCGLRSRRGQKALTGFLHDLGVILNYGDDPRLEDTHILSPQWVTRGVYGILNSNLLFQNKGVLAREDLDWALDPSGFPSDKQTIILEIMRKFELCFPFDGDDERLLVPDLLPKEEPFTGDWGDSLVFEYRYDVLPGSVLSRLIVRMHPFIHQSTVWRSGVVLVYDDNLALIRGDLEDRKISISVNGFLPGRPVFLTIIRRELDSIHRSLPGLVVEERVALRGSEVTVAYRHLKTLKEMEITDFVPEGAQEMVNVRSLLSEIEIDPQSEEPSIPIGDADEDLPRKRSVFLAYNSKDKEIIRSIAFQLRSRGLDTWLDLDRMVPGRWIQDSLQEGLNDAQSAAFFLGKSGLGQWQTLELRALLERCIERDIPLIPVLLPGVQKIPDSLSFLRQLTPVRFKRSVDEREALDLLEWGIRGRSPFSSRAKPSRLNG